MLWTHNVKAGVIRGDLMFGNIRDNQKNQRKIERKQLMLW